MDMLLALNCSGQPGTKVIAIWLTSFIHTLIFKDGGFPSILKSIDDIH